MNAATPGYERVRRAATKGTVSLFMPMYNFCSLKFQRLSAENLTSYMMLLLAALSKVQSLVRYFISPGRTDEKENKTSAPRFRQLQRTTVALARKDGAAVSLKLFEMVGSWETSSSKATDLSLQRGCLNVKPVTCRIWRHGVSDLSYWFGATAVTDRATASLEAAIPGV